MQETFIYHVFLFLSILKILHIVFKIVQTYIKETILFVSNEELFITFLSISYVLSYIIK